MENLFDWVPFYKELARKLLPYQDNHKELVAKVRLIYEITGINMPTLEKDNQLFDMDPFTFFGLFNKSSMKESNRIAIVQAIAELFDIQAPIPTSFSSIPVLNNQNATFYYLLDSVARKISTICGGCFIVRLRMLMVIQQIQTLICSNTTLTE